MASPPAALGSLLSFFLPLPEGWRKRSAVLGYVLACYRADDDETHADTGADYTERQRPPVPGLCTAHDQKGRNGL